MDYIESKQDNETIATQQSMNKPRKFPSFFVMIGATVLAVMLIVFLVIKLGGNKIDLADYYMIEVSGINEYAVASVKDNKNAETAYLRDFATTENLLLVSLFFDSISFELSAEDNISNGDKITATAIYDEEAAKSLDIKFSKDSFSITVSGLENGIEADLFENVEIEFSGISPYGSATVYNNSGDEERKGITYAIDSETDLKNGDTVTVTATLPSDSKIIPKNITKTYTVEGLSEYITNELTEIQKEELNNEIMDYVDSYVASHIDTLYYAFKADEAPYFMLATKSHTEPTLISQTLLIVKENSNESVINQFISIYEITINTTSNNGENIVATGYFNITLQDVVISDDNKLTFDEFSSYNTTLDKNQDSLYENIITTEKDRYTIHKIS